MLIVTLVTRAAARYARRRCHRFAAVIAGLLTCLLAQVALGYAAVPQTARIYVRVYFAKALGKSSDGLADSKPVITAYDLLKTSAEGPRSLHPVVHVTSSSANQSDFVFSLPQGSYDLFIKFAGERSIGRNGPLLVLDGMDRHLVVQKGGVSDWHAASGVAGIIAFDGLQVGLIKTLRPMHCGDSTNSLSDPAVTRSPGVTDGKAYYINFQGYGPQNGTLALDIRGALFSHGVILLTDTQTASPKSVVFLVKNVTEAVVRGAMTHREMITCIPGL